MSLQLRHCPRCGALQADVPECSACGANLLDRGGRASGDELSSREVLRLASVLVTLFGGFVVVAILILSAIAMILR